MALLLGQYVFLLIQEIQPMKKILSISLPAVLLLALQGAAWAEEPPAPPPGGDHQGMIEQADTNKDGKVSFDEFKTFHDAKMQEMFKKLDTNGDGFVDKEEARKAREGLREKMRDRMEKRRPQ